MQDHERRETKRYPVRMRVVCDDGLSYTSATIEDLSPDGMLICDDYGSRKCPGAYKAVNEFMADKPEGILHLPTGQSIVYKQ